MPFKNPDWEGINYDKPVNKKFPFKFDYRIFVTKSAYDEIYKHAANNNKVEIGGVLIGNVCKDDAGYFLEITNVIKARETENTMSNVTFTHETWADILNKKDTKFANKLIVGWYHSHPDFDIFLSPQDMHIHGNFFNQPHQVAFVIDPINKKEGFFVWKDGVTKAIGEYWIGRERKEFIEKKVEEDEPVDENEGKTTTREKIDLILKWAVPGLVVLAMVLSLFYNLKTNYNLMLSRAQNQEYEQVIGVLKSVYENVYHHDIQKMLEKRKNTL